MDKRQGDRRNVSRPLACIHSTNQHTKTHLLPKFCYKEAYGWKVINPINRVLQVNFHIWPTYMTFDLITWRFSMSNYQPSLIGPAWHRHVVEELWTLELKQLIWPENIVGANIGHLPTKFGYKQAYGWEVINPYTYRVLQVNFQILPHLTFDLLTWPLTPNIVEANIGHFPPSLVTNRHMVQDLPDF